MARCFDCNKFVSLELGESPDLNIDVDAEGVVTGDVSIYRNCAECGTEMKQGDFEINLSIPEVIAHAQEHTDARAEKDKADAEARERGEEPADSDAEDPDDVELTITNEEAEATEGGTSRKATYGYRASFTISCSCGKFEHDAEVDGEMLGSEMDELT